MEEYYRARAPEYEQIYYREVPARRAEIDDEAARLRELVKGRKVLELACGTGYWTRIMSQTAASITASDISSEMIAEARGKEFGCEVDFVEADMFSHSFGEARFDVVALGFWFSHQPKQDYERLFDVLGRPLKKEGLIWMIDNNPPAEGDTVDTCRTDAEGNNYKYRFLSDGTKYVILKNYFTKAELEGLFAPRYDIQYLVHKEYYWSAVLAPPWRKISLIR
jgi:ubiquinone/menaquinone biosynthesis C-methylase UbiE